MTFTFSQVVTLKFRDRKLKSLIRTCVYPNHNLKMSKIKTVFTLSHAKHNNTWTNTWTQKWQNFYSTFVFYFN